LPTGIERWRRDLIENQIQDGGRRLCVAQTEINALHETGKKKNKKDKKKKKEMKKEKTKK